MEQEIEEKKEEKETKLKKYKSRNFNLLLYPQEDETHRKAFDYIKKNYDYAMICHDKDLNEFNELKKEHYHFVIRFDNPKWNTALADELGIKSNYIEESRSLKRSLLYLIHYYDDNKYQYDVSSVSGSLTNRLYEFMSNLDKSSSEKFQELMKYIDDYEGELTPATFVRYSVSVGYLDLIRRNWNQFIVIINDHNDLFRLMTNPHDE